MKHSTALRTVRQVHTLAWAILGSCVVALIPMAWTRRFGLALGLATVVLAEVAVLAVNDWHCPLMPIAARYTDDRRPNFDIYLPEWLARYNKEIFGTLYVVGLVTLLGRWAGWF